MEKAHGRCVPLGGSASVEAGFPLARGIGRHGAVELGFANFALAAALVVCEIWLGAPGSCAALDGLRAILGIQTFDGTFAGDAHLDVLR